MNDKPSALPDFTKGTINLASARLGAKAVDATDEFFAPLERMLKDEEAVFIEDKYDDNGKWMDGWESRRKRTPGHDWAIISLAKPGRIFGFDIDTSHFTGNYPPGASIEGTFIDGDDGPDDNTQWTQILSQKDLGPGIGAAAHHFFEVDDRATRKQVFTHLRLHIYPDGGIARLRVYGTPKFDWSKVGVDEEIDLAYLFHGGRPLAWSDAHFGEPERLLSPGRGVNMGDGWETARRRGPGHDWTIIKLGHAGIISGLTVDTAHFKGNFPETCELCGAYLPEHTGAFSEEEISASQDWQTIMPKQKLQADNIHEFGPEHIGHNKPVTHVRFKIHPDGGVSRLRIKGKVAR
ncbi:MAG: allantoicase [Rhizobiaceae bacterium]|nr:allantoicase [Rhizobiaceae bacterium]